MRKFFIVFISVLLICIFSLNSFAAPVNQIECLFSKPTNFVDFNDGYHYFYGFSDSSFTYAFIVELSVRREGSSSAITSTVTSTNNSLVWSFSNVGGNGIRYVDYTIYLRSGMIRHYGYLEFSTATFSFSYEDLWFETQPALSKIKYVDPVGDTSDIPVTYSFSGSRELAYDLFYFSATNDGINFISVLPEPVADQYNSFVLIANELNCFLVSISSAAPILNEIPIRFVADDRWLFQFVNTGNNTSFTLMITVFDATSGRYVSGADVIVPANTIYNYGFTNSYADPISYPYCTTYGCMLDNSIYEYPISRVPITFNYNGSTDALLTLIYSSITMFHRDISQELVNSFNTLISELGRSNSTLALIRSVLNNIYNAIRGNPNDYPQVNTDALNDYIDLESSLNQNYNSDLNSAVTNALDIFNTIDGTSSTSTFSFLQYLMNSFVFNGGKFQALVIFSLSIGIGVLILGRKVN